MAFGKYVQRQQERAASRKAATTSAATRSAIPPVPTIRSSGLAEDVCRFLTRFEDRRLGGEWLHVSALYDLCTREHVLAKQAIERTGVVPARIMTPQLRVRFDMGRYFAELIRNEYLGPMGRLWGDWRCLSCGAFVESQVMPKACTCRNGAWMYEEREVRHDALKIVAHVDGFDLDPVLDKVVLELKSVEGAIFKSRSLLPLARDVFQASVYCWLTGTKAARLFYASMSLETNHLPFKEFTIPFDVRVPARVERIVQEVRAGGKRACESRDDARAIACPHAGPCFAAKR